jgi:hypothetical protein
MKPIMTTGVVPILDEKFGQKKRPVDLWVTASF